MAKIPLTGLLSMEPEGGDDNQGQLTDAGAIVNAFEKQRLRL